MTMRALLLVTHPTVCLHRALEAAPTGPLPRGRPGGERVMVTLLARPPHPPQVTPHRLVRGHSTSLEGGLPPSMARLTKGSTLLSPESAKSPRAPFTRRLQG
jgi:hypothetical protein